ncbi:hypothetical protein PGT21_024157 [Puccinia graminis f. sp. tritici]|uniref:J domain-containing protein n=2 Tax=Puccinia graminis f. sp. tritici TaxID=56615 RepID=A0A5B0N1E1_PUCGR|nr:hypothetical protein PGT21_024157 [Puccinia graminis f. sp. tritici]
MGNIICKIIVCFPPEVGPYRRSPQLLDKLKFWIYYKAQAGIANRHRKDGNNHYHKKEYQNAINCYTRAIKCDASQEYPYSVHQYMRRFRHPVYSASLANRASAYMALGEYQRSSEDLREAIDRFDPSLTESNRATLIKRVFRLVRCHLALLDGLRGLDALRKFDFQFHPHDPDISEYQRLLSRTELLVNIKKSIDNSRSTNQYWQTTLNLIQSLDKKIEPWGFKFNYACLPGSWTYWKVEALAHLGKTVEAEEVLDRCIKADTTNVDCLLVPKLISSMDKIERSCSQSRHFAAVEQCDELLVSLKDPMLTTLRMKVVTIRCEQLAEQCLKYRSPESHLCYQIVASNAALHEELNFTCSKRLSTKPDIYEPHRIYLLRSLIALARSTYRSRKHKWSLTYLVIADLLCFWPDLLLSSREGIFEEICARTNSKKSSFPRFDNSFPHSSQSRSSGSNHNTGKTNGADSDPKGYYRTLGVRTNASREEIKEAYRKLILIHHPDKGGQAESFRKIHLAYEILFNPESRSAYDQTCR